MSKKSRQTIRIHNKDKNSKHNIPIELIPVTDRLEKLCFANGKMGVSYYTPIGKKDKNKIDIFKFDENTNAYLLKISGGKFLQRFYLPVYIPKDNEELKEACKKFEIPLEICEKFSHNIENLKAVYVEKIIKTFYGI